MAEKQNQYEAMFLMGSAASAELESSMGLCRKIIEKQGCQVILIKKWDERKLAYEIEGQKRGLYILAFFRGPGAALAGIDRDVRLNESILRAMVLRADHLNETEMAACEPQPIQVREERSYEHGTGGGYGHHDRWDRGEQHGSDSPSRPAPRDDAGTDKPDDAK